jgi:ATP-dependent Clp protease ATP-binding subunit ClpA
MDDNDIERLKNISNRLRSKIIGQDQAVEATNWTVAVIESSTITANCT